MDIVRLKTEQKSSSTEEKFPGQQRKLKLEWNFN